MELLSFLAIAALCASIVSSQGTDTTQTTTLTQTSTTTRIITVVQVGPKVDLTTSVLSSPTSSDIPPSTFTSIPPSTPTSVPTTSPTLAPSSYVSSVTSLLEITNATISAPWANTTMTLATTVLPTTKGSTFTTALSPGTSKASATGTSAAAPTSKVQKGLLLGAIAIGWGIVALGIS